METLSEIFKRIGHFGPDVGQNDKGSTHSYVDVYETLLAPFRQRCDLLEIGIAAGDSMRLWGDYLGTDSTITGLDLSLTFDTNGFDSRFKFIIGDATKPDIIDKLGGKMFDVVIDDASHMQADQVATFKLLKGHVKPGGIYVIEDILSPDTALTELRGLHSPHEVYDLRKVKGRFDDMLVVFRF